MGFFRRRDDGRESIRLKAAKRLDRLPAREVMNFVDASMAGAWKAMEDYAKKPDSFLLDEAERGLQQALGAIDSLRNRLTSSPP